MAQVDVVARDRAPDCPFCAERLDPAAARFRCAGCGPAVHEACAVERRDLACPNQGCGGVLNAASLASDLRVQEARRAAPREPRAERTAGEAQPAGPTARRRSDHRAPLASQGRMTMAVRRLPGASRVSGSLCAAGR